jgi:hypothetical protein
MRRGGSPPIEPLALPPGVEASAEAVADFLRGAGVDPISWSNGPDDRYAPYGHGYTKLVMCASGSITFLVGDGEAPIELTPGRGFVLPPGTRHAAVVGTEGCRCVEGHRPL